MAVRMDVVVYVSHYTDGHEHREVFPANMPVMPDQSSAEERATAGVMRQERTHGPVRSFAAHPGVVQFDEGVRL